MASVKKRGSNWQATYRALDGRERTKTFARKADADRWAATEVAAMHRGEWIDPRAGRVTFAEYAERWRTAQIHRASTGEAVERSLRNHILPTFGARPLASIRTTEVQGWVKSLEARLAPATVGLVYGFAASIFRAAVLDRVLAVSPCVKIKLPKKAPEQVVPLETEVVKRLAESVPGRYRALVITCAGTGLRQGEVFGLTADRIDFLRRQLVVDRQMVKPTGGGWYFGPPKTASSYRTIPLPGVVIDELAAHLATFGPDGLVFTNEARQPLSRSSFGTMWRRSVAAAGAPTGTGMHDLRHYYASLLIRHGESVKTVQARLGHKDATETLNTYSHLWPDSEDRTRAAVDEILGNGADISRTRETGLT